MATKAEKLKASVGGNVRESIGVGREVAAPEAAPKSGRDPRFEGVSTIKEARRIPLANLVGDPDQPRKSFTQSELKELAESIRMHGQIQPIRVRWRPETSTYMVVVGERRVRALQLLEATHVDAIVESDDLTDSAISLRQMTENLIRLDMAPVEQAEAMDRIMKARGWSTRELATNLGISQSRVQKSLSILKLPEEVQEKVKTKQIAPAVAREIAKLDSPEEQVAVAEQAIAEDLNREEVAEVVTERIAAQPEPEAADTPAARGKVAVSRKAKTKAAAKAKGKGSNTCEFREGEFRITIESRKSIANDRLSIALQTISARIRAAEPVAVG